MTAIIERLIGPLPIWARRDHPLLRYLLRTKGRRLRGWLVLLLGLLIGGLLIGVGFLIATEFLTRPLPATVTEIMNRIAYGPLLMLQTVLWIAAMSLTIGAVGDSERRQQWDMLRVTESGAGLSLRTRWASVFFTLRTLLAIVVFVRVILIVGILSDLMAFQGEYLDLLISGIEPQMTIPLSIGDSSLDLGIVAGILLLAFMLTASLLLPFTALGFDAAFGLLLSTFIRQRTYTALAQVVLIAIRLAIVAGLLYAALGFMDNAITVPDGSPLPLMFAFGAFADWGLYYMHLGSLGEVWAIVPYGIFLGLALLIFALFQAFVTERMLQWATARAQLRG